MALLQRKNEESYFTVLNAVKKEWGTDVKFSRFHADYEQAHIRALTTVFDKEKIYGCIFHYASALVRYVKKEFPNIHQSYNKDKEGLIHKWVNFL